MKSVFVRCKNILDKGLLIVALLMLFCIFLSACSGNEETDPVRQAVLSSFTVKGSINQWEAAPLFGGEVVFVNDSAVYWVKDGKVYAVNGVALNWSEGAPKAAPSVGVKEIQLAFAGKAPVQEKAFGMSYEVFFDRVGQELKKQKFSEDYKKLTFKDYSVGDGAILYASEQGGALTGARYEVLMRKMKIRAGEESLLMLGIMRVLSPSTEEKELKSGLKFLFNTAFEKKEASVSLGNVSYEMVVKPAFISLSASPL